MENSTKQRILEKALEMFAEKGYEGTNLRDLAQSLGLSKSALYRHFESKEEIWNSLYETLREYYNEHFGAEDNLPPVPSSGSELVATTMHMVDFTVHDKNIVLMRRLLTREQFRDEKIRPLATEYFLNCTENMFTKLFRKMMLNGIMKADNPQLLALEYTAPITVLIHLCDREPEKIPEAMERIQSFAEHFASVYCEEKMI